MALLKKLKFKIINYILELEPIKAEVRKREIGFLGDMMSAPSTYDFYAGKGHPLNDGPTDQKGARYD